jgi:Zn-dependent oligopeptidase
MRLKHNKKRNTAFVYEALVRELTESVVKNNKNKQNKIVSIIKEHFSGSSILKKELELYKTIYETRHIEKDTAEKIVVQVKQEHESLDKRKLFLEQSALINKINRTLSTKIYSNFVPNYKTIASVHSIFQETLPIKDRVLLEENIVEQMSASVNTVQETQQPIDSLVYNTFVTKFNEEYSGSLNESQKNLLGTYISSFQDNGINLKIYLNEEIGRLKAALAEMKEQNEDSDLKEKLGRVYNILDETKDKGIDTETLEIVLSTQQLLEDLEDGN